MNIFRFRSSSNAAASTPEIAVDHGPVTYKALLTPPSDYEPVLNAPLNEEQQEKINRLLSHIESIMLPKDDPYYPNERGFVTEGTVHRYMRARKWDYEAAKTMLENTIKWRREFKPDQIDPNYVRAEAETGKMYFSGFDKTGRPLWIMKPRHENSKDSERQVKHIVFCLERGIRLMPQNVEKISIVVDFKDSTASNNAGVSTCKKFLDILGNHYPERLGIAFLVNAPWFFLATFKIISPFMDPVTRNKIKFINPAGSNPNTNTTANSSQINMEDMISADQMEISLGGKYNFAFDPNVYWADLLKITGDPYQVIEYN
ncbi:CRAL-TRIO domain-containing protein [Mycotypha africana]|uniref:CRAL-TRIO domain-containing protein n=1 Tax=Mycotypha africana TaxID=64632 RepID=UPI00230041C1|nr:CRAL-TRIO domain-containing protein [Mycotypha africana]KAI8982424.1 CRAL-TRIO domain-containing protein [Mycotypha africana]